MIDDMSLCSLLYLTVYCGDVVLLMVGDNLSNNVVLYIIGISMRKNSNKEFVHLFLMLLKYLLMLLRYWQ